MSSVEGEVEGEERRGLLIEMGHSQPTPKRWSFV